MPECTKCPANNHKPWIESGQVPAWVKVSDTRHRAYNDEIDADLGITRRGGISMDKAEFDDAPCSCCTYDPEKPNNQGKTLISLDALHMETGTDFDDEEVGDKSKPMSEFEIFREYVTEKISVYDVQAETIPEAIAEVLEVVYNALEDAHFQKTTDNAQFQDAIEFQLQFSAQISQLPEVAKRAVNWKMIDSNASFEPLAEELDCTPQYVNQCYLKALQEHPFLGHCMKNRSSKVERYKSEHVKDAQALGDILGGLS